MDVQRSRSESSRISVIADDRQDEPPKGYEVARDVTGAGVGAVIGAVGGPAGILAGTIAGAALPHAMDAIRNWMSGRRDRVLMPAADAVGGDAALAKCLEGNEELVPLVLRAADAAAKTAWEAHVDALAAVLRDGITGRVTVSEADELMSAIGTMTPDAVLVVDYVTTHEPQSDSFFADKSVADALGISLSRARVAFRRLEDGGAVETLGGLTDGGESWVSIPLATRVLAYLRDAGAV